MRKPHKVALAALVLFSLVLATSGCIETRTDEIPEWVPDWAIPEGTAVETGSPADPGPEPDTDTGEDIHGRALPFGTHGHGGEVLLLGRSVMYGWFDHWEWGEQNGLLRDGWALYYGELDSPPGIADSAVWYIEAVPETTIVCFKLCFVDFWAQSQSDVQSGLDENLSYVQSVVDAAQAKGTPLVLFTALPEVAANTSAPLLDLHRQYGQAVADIAASSDGVWVFDANEVLTDQTGALYRGFAVSPDDAHLNDVAYMELDEAFFSFLAESFGPE